jgi:hypothetical protein
LAAIFAAYDLAWLIPVIPLVGLAPLTLITLCGTDPPLVPTFTQAEVSALRNLTIGANFNNGLGKLKDLALNAIWHDACQCNSGPTPMLSPAAPPADMPIVQWNAGNSVCMTIDSGVVPRPQPQALTTIQPTIVVPNTVVGFQTTWYNTPAGTTHDAVRAASRIFYTNGTSQPPQAFDLAPTPQYEQPYVALKPDGALPASFGSMADVDAFAGKSNSDSWRTVTRIYCGIGQLAPQNCCSDPAVQAYLETILRTVTLTQRQAVPFAYLTGTVHSALTGNGDFAVQGLVGAKLQPTVFPPSLGTITADPTEYFDMGWFSWGTADGFDQRIRLTHSPQISTPARAAVYTRLAYSFPPGVTVTLTELIREP